MQMPAIKQHHRQGHPVLIFFDYTFFFGQSGKSAKAVFSFATARGLPSRPAAASVSLHRLSSTPILLPPFLC